jgi:hypothetical protein
MISTDNWVEICDLLGRYCWAVDEADAAGFTSCWTEDGELTGAGPEPLKGHTALAGMANGMRGQGMRHLYSNLTCDYVGGDREKVRAKFYNYVSLYGEAAGVLGMALCDALIVRQGGEWKVKTNHLNILMPKQPA